MSNKLSEFDLSKMQYIKPKRTKHIYISQILYNENEINVQLRKKITPSGVYREGNKYYLDLTCILK